MTITLNLLHDQSIPVAEDFNYNFRALKAAAETLEALAATMTPTPPGGMIDYGGATAPPGWLLCNGAAVSRTTYSALFAAIGTLWGAGDGSSTFNVPDFRGRTSVGAGAGTGLTERFVGGHGGEEAHSLTTAEGPPHTHPVTPTGGGSFVTNRGGPTGYTLPAGDNIYPGDTAVATSSGNGTPHNTMPPFNVAPKIIKT